MRKLTRRSRDAEVMELFTSISHTSGPAYATYHHGPHASVGRLFLFVLVSFIYKHTYFIIEHPSVNSYLKPPYGSNEQSAIRIPLARTKPQPGMLTPVNTGNAPVPRLKPRRTRCLTSVRMKMRTQRPCIARMWRLAGGFWGTIIPARLHPSTR